MTDLSLRPKRNDTHISYLHASGSKATSPSSTEQEESPTEHTPKSRAKSKSKSKPRSKSRRKSKSTLKHMCERLPTVTLCGFFVNRNFLEHKHLKGPYSFSETITHPPGCECDMDTCNGRMQSWGFDALAEQARSAHAHDGTREAEDGGGSMRMGFPLPPSGGVSRNVGVPLTTSLGVELAQQHLASLAQPPSDPLPQRWPFLQPLPQDAHRRLAVEAPGPEDLLRRQVAAVMPRRFRNDRHVSSTRGSRSPQRFVSAHRPSPLSGRMTMPRRLSAPSLDGRMRDSERVAVPSSQQGRHPYHLAFPDFMASGEPGTTMMRDRERIDTELDALRRRLEGESLGYESSRFESNRASVERMQSRGAMSPDEAVSGMGERLLGGPGEEVSVSQGEQGQVSDLNFGQHDDSVRF